MTNRSTWKRREREIAAYFGTERTPLSGGNSKHTRSDTLHDKLFVEAKYRQRSAVWTLFESTDELAAQESKLPLLTLCQKQKPGFLIVAHSDDFEEIAVGFLKERGFSVRAPKRATDKEQ